MIHALIKERLSRRPVEWDDAGLSTQERIPLTPYMVGYEETKCEKVPRWILRLALESLFLNPCLHYTLLLTA
jgi:hypothetical protein